MEDRRPIREYLDNPILLRKVSIEDLQLWAEEVSYPVIIHHLMAIKVVQEEPSESNKHVIRDALAFSPNPNRLSRELYEIALSYESEDQESNLVDAVADTIKYDEEESQDEAHSSNLDSTGEPIESVNSEEQSDENEVDDVTDNPDGLTSFSEWLLSLEQIEVAELEEVGDEEIISEALASLLVRQGHNQEALVMYERLALKYPEKSTYFAAQIENLRVS